MKITHKPYVHITKNIPGRMLKVGKIYKFTAGEHSDFTVRLNKDGIYQERFYEKRWYDMGREWALMNYFDEVSDEN